MYMAHLLNLIEKKRKKELFYSNVKRITRFDIFEKKFERLLKA